MRRRSRCGAAARHPGGDRDAHDAPAAKVAATRGYGAEVVIYDRYREDREAIGRRLADERGMTLIPPYDHADVIAGQGTAAKELFDEVGALDACSSASAAAACSAARRWRRVRWRRRCKLYGVEPEAGNDAQQSFAAGAIVHIDDAEDDRRRRADPAARQLTFAIIRRDVDDIVTASDEELVARCASSPRA